MIIRNFSIMFMDENVADVHVDGIRNTRIQLYTDVRYKQPLCVQINNFLAVYEFLRSRCYEDGRTDLNEILGQAGLKDNNPWEWVKISHGVTFDDYFWVRFPGEDLNWKDVMVRE